MSEGSDGWFVRARGRILGPFTLSQLSSLRDRGQLSQFHEVSPDRRSWIRAAGVPELFGKAGGGWGAFAQPSGVDAGGYSFAVDPGASPGPIASASAPSWFFARGGTHHGPLDLADLQRMADTGEIGPGTLVWK